MTLEEMLIEDLGLEAEIAELERVEKSDATDLPEREE